MTLPAYSSYCNGNDTYAWEKWRSFGRDKTTPRPYEAVFRRCNDLLRASSLMEPLPGRTNGEVLAYNKAYADFVSQCKEKANMALNLAELGQTYSLLTDVFIGLRECVKGMKTGNIGRFKEGLHHLGATPRSLREFSKDFSRNWLAYQYAIKPAINDATTLMRDKIFQKFNDSDYTVKGKGSVTIPHSFVISGGHTYTQSHNWNVLISANVTMSNPSLYKASQTGLVNLPGLAYELIPFSFVLDWAVNVGDLLNALDDFAGLSLRDAYSTTFFRGTSTDLYDLGRYGKSYFTGSIDHIWRRVGQPTGPKLALNFPIQSPMRMMNALALCIPTLLSTPKR